MARIASGLLAWEKVPKINRKDPGGNSYLPAYLWLERKEKPTKACALNLCSLVDVSW